MYVFWIFKGLLHFCKGFSLNFRFSRTLIFFWCGFCSISPSTKIKLFDKIRLNSCKATIQKILKYQQLSEQFSQNLNQILDWLLQYVFECLGLINLYISHLKLFCVCEIVKPAKLLQISHWRTIPNLFAKKKTIAADCSKYFGTRTWEYFHHLLG